MLKGHDLTYLDYYVPQNTTSISDLISNIDARFIPAFFETKEDYLIFAETVLGLQQIKVEEKMDKATMIGNLLCNMFENKVVEPGDIDLLIVTEEVRRDAKENLGKRLQHQFGLKKAFVLNISGNHCANMAIAWSLADKHYGYADEVNNILIVNAAITEHNHDRIIGTYGILSDGAGVLLLQRKTGICSLVDNISLSNGMLNQVDMNKDYSLLHMKYTMQSVNELLARNKVHPDKIAKVISQNANPLLVTNAIMQTGIQMNRMFTDNLGELGHMDSLDLVVNLKDVIDSHSFNDDEFLLAYNMGWAGSYVSSLISIN